MMDTEKLIALEEIRQLKARYMYFTDMKDWGGFVTVFAEDADIDMRDSFTPVAGPSYVYGRPELLQGFDTSGWRWTGAKEMAANGAAQFAQTSLVHQSFNAQITMHSPDMASGIWAMQDMLRFPPGSPIEEIIGYGHYHESYRRIDGNWLIQSMTLKRTRMDVK
jgi:hypothetical protein